MRPPVGVGLTGADRSAGVPDSTVLLGNDQLQQHSVGCRQTLAGWITVGFPHFFTGVLNIIYIIHH
jgi:hypothetical protein